MAEDPEACARLAWACLTPECWALSILCQVLLRDGEPEAQEGPSESGSPGRRVEPGPQVSPAGSLSTSQLRGRGRPCGPHKPGTQRNHKDGLK